MNLSSIKNSIKNLPRRKKIAILGSTVLVIGAILGVSVAQQNQDNRSKAAAPMQDGYQGIESVGSAGSEPEVVPGEVLIKLKSTANSVVPDQVNAQNPGRESLRQLNSAVRAERFERIFERRQGVLQQSQPDTSWYKVKTTTATSLPKAISRSRNPAEFNQVLTLVEQYKKDPDVEIAEPNYVVRAALTPNDPEYAARGRFSGYDNMWGLKKINMASAWDQSTGNNIVVAVIDSGVDRNHPDISANMTNGWDFVNNDSDPNDDNGHGTHVAGILGATGNNGNKIPGANWRVKIMAIKVLN
ncbi:MAG TPA: S8 family serine peptidase, partial [Xanthomonadales bacterium]|nr:S8 family serine peptidase [Xanthomonadales bacterium]